MTEVFTHQPFLHTVQVLADRRLTLVQQHIFQKRKASFQTSAQSVKGTTGCSIQKTRTRNSWLSFTTLWSGEKDLGPQSFYIASPGKDQLDGKSILFCKDKIKN